jgi:O-antigen ligase
LAAAAKAAAQAAVQPAPAGPGLTERELFRRLLLGAVIALVVARPLVLGEDPGLILDRSSFPVSPVLTLSWLGLALAWAIYRIVANENDWRGSLVEIGLLGVVGVVFISAGVGAAYKHPAWLIAWEWLTLLVIFCLVRQLVREPEDNRRLLAALVATGVCLSAYAVYQYAVEIPGLQETIRSSPGRLRQALARENIFLDEQDPQIDYWLSRIQSRFAFATFAHPNAFAGYLALLLPAGVGWAIVAWRRQGWCVSTVLAIGAALLLAIGLLLTHSRGGILGCLVIGVAVLFAYVGRSSGLWRRWLPAAVLACVVLLGAAWLAWGEDGFRRARQSLALRGDYWRATASMIWDAKHPRQFWLGVGPGNFSRYYPRYMDPAATEEVSDPHNFLLEMAATCGIFGALLLAATLAAFFWRTRSAWRAWRSTARESIDERPRTLPWEFYGGGMVGLILGFALATAGRSADEILVNGAISMVRSMVWFAAFALLDSIRWPGVSRALALVAGVAACLLNLTVSGGLFFPSVAQPLWIMAALAINALPAPAASLRSNPWAGTVLPFPVTAGLCVAYSALVFVPVTGCAGFLGEAQAFIAEWQTRESPLMRKQMETAKNEQAKQMIGLGISQKLEKRILQPLEAAARQDSHDSYPLLEAAKWQGERWSALHQKESREKAFQSLQKAIKLDPEGKLGYITEYQLMLLFARGRDSDVKNLYALAVKALLKAVEIAPTESRLRFQLAESLFLADDPVEGRSQARKAQELDEKNTDPVRKLSDAQREQIGKWLATSPAN